jgi:threonine dehydrogenase-like Zn-dependent dehydrogenase
MTVFGTHDHGAHAPLMRVPASTLVPLNSSLSFKAGAAIACGTGTAWGALDRLGDVGGATIAIFGQGPVGLSGTLLANARGARVIAVDVQPSRLEQARRMGAADTINAADETSVADAIRQLTRGEGVSMALETSGATPAIADSIACIALWGRVCFVGLGGEVCFPVAGNHLRQLTLVTSISMSIVQQRKCAEFVSNNDLNVDALFSHEWRLDDVIEAYEWFDRQDAGKGVILLGEQ